MKWAYGVTTVPDRRSSYLPRTLKSLAFGGFDKPHLFVDGDANRSLWETSFPGLDLTMRWPKINVVGNWTLAMIELYIRNPQADRYVLFQDDVVTGLNLRPYLERIQMPAKGYCNLITYPSTHEAKPASLRTGWFKTQQNGRGAHGIMMTGPTIQTILSANLFFNHPKTVRGFKKLDAALVDSAKERGWAEYVHWPSLLLTIGDVSTIHHRKQPPAETFPGEDFDFLRLLEKNKV